VTTDLVTFLRACLDDDERIARAALDPKHLGEWVWRKDSRTTVQTDDGAPIEPTAPSIERGPHIARWHPARVLAEVEAKRAILGIHDPGDTTQTRRWCAYCVEPGKPEFMARMPCQHLRLLATAYTGQPGFREEWRP
jgi:hypothetical protein